MPCILQAIMDIFYNEIDKIILARSIVHKHCCLIFQTPSLINFLIIRFIIYLQKALIFHTFLYRIA